MDPDLLDLLILRAEIAHIKNNNYVTQSYLGHRPQIASRITSPLLNSKVIRIGEEDTSKIAARSDYLTYLRLTLVE